MANTEKKQLSSTQWLVRTAVILALALLFQMIRFVIGNAPWTSYLIGTLVNLALIVAVYLVGGWSASVVAVLTPVVAYFQGHAVLPLVPAVALGNLALVWIFAAFKNKNWVIPILPAAVIKFLIIAAGMAFFVVPQPLNAVKIGTVASAQVVQVVTAILAGVIARPIVKGLAGGGAIEQR
nr:hypothetical protein [Maliibacterium massiliense]